MAVNSDRATAFQPRQHSKTVSKKTESIPGCPDLCSSCVPPVKQGGVLRGG